MSLFDDIIKALPENTILRERLRVFIDENESLKTENAICKDSLREKDVKIAALQKVVDQFAHVDDLHEIEIQIITLLAKHIQVSEMDFSASLGVIPATARHHLEQLRERHFVAKKSGMPCDSYALTKEGRAFASENHLIEYPASPLVR